MKQKVQKKIFNKQKGQLTIFGNVENEGEDYYSDVWLTPRSFFNKINKEFNFDIDVATEENNPLNTKYFFTEKDNSLTKKWSGNVWLNPPYSNIDDWVKKAFTEWKRERESYCYANTRKNWY